MADNKYVGKCPVCQGQLVLNNETGVLTCSKKEHYRILRKDFEGAWKAYESNEYGLGKLFSMVMKGKL